MSERAPQFKIGLIGPTNVGKTSLIASVLHSTESMLADSPVTIQTADSATRKILADYARTLQGSLLARTFNPGALGGTQDRRTFRLSLTGGQAGEQLEFVVLDYPGRWVDGRTEAEEKDWAFCEQWIKDSSVLLVPIDAPVLMEAVESRHKQALPSILTTHEVGKIARTWAKRRGLDAPAPAMLLLCPLKCESYFADNGGRRDRSVDLMKLVQHVYADTIRAVREEAPHATILYAPIDTIGCVEIVRADWVTQEGDPGVKFSASYRVRTNPHQSVKGADSIMLALIKHLMAAKRRLEEMESSKLSEEARRAHELALRDEGFFGNIRLWWNDERTKREENAKGALNAADQQRSKLRSLLEVLKQLESQSYGPRVQIFE